MKIILGLAIAILIAGSGYAYLLIEQNQLKDQQVSDYRAQVSQLLSETETNSLARLDYEKQIGSLQSEVNTLSSQLTSVSNQLQMAQQESESPDIRALEQEIRQQLVEEFQQQDNVANAGSRTGLVKQLAAMDATERSELMSMQNRYGDFLGSLDVSDQRMDVIIGALGNVIATENAARMEVLQQVQAGQVDLAEVRDKMLGIHDQDNMLNELSYVLTEQELAAFSDYQDTQASSRIAVLGTQAGGLIQSETFYLSAGPDGSPLNGEIRILTVEPGPDNQ